MKLVVLMCVEEYAETGRKLLREAGVPGFSESEMQGYKPMDVDESDNWFADKHLLENSHIFFTMCTEEKAEQVLNSVEKCKAENNVKSVHAFQLGIEKFVG